MSDSYARLRSSGDMVGGAVQTILNVQGSLDDLREDLGTEYKRAKNKKQELTTKRDQLVAEIQERQNELLNQQSLREYAARLSGDLRLATEATAKLNETRSAAWVAHEETQGKLNDEIHHLFADINAAEFRKQLILNATQDRIEAIRAHQHDLHMEIFNLRQNISAVQRERSEHHTQTSHEQSYLLAQIAETRRQYELVRKELEEQAKVQLERKRLADQAHEVVRQREELDSQRVNCTNRLHQLDLQIAAAQKQYDDDTAAMTRCQDIDAENMDLQRAVNECAAAQNAPAA